MASFQVPVELQSEGFGNPSGRISNMGVLYGRMIFTGSLLWGWGYANPFFNLAEHPYFLIGLLVLGLHIDRNRVRGRVGKLEGSTDFF